MPVFPTATVITSITSATVVPCSDGSARQEILITDLVRLGSVQPAAASGAGATYTIQAQNAGSGNSAGGNLVLVPGAKAGSGADGRLRIQQPGSATNYLELYNDGIFGGVLRGVLNGSTGTIFLASGLFINGSNSFQFGDSTKLRFGTDASILFASNVPGDATPDISLKRAGSKVLAIGDGSTGGATLSSPPSSVVTLSGTTNDYAHNNVLILQLKCVGSAKTLTGLAAGYDGQLMLILNAGATTDFNIVLSNDSSSSSAANRFYLYTSSVSIPPRCFGIAVYSSTASRWFVHCPPGQ